MLQSLRIVSERQGVTTSLCVYIAPWLHKLHFVSIKPTVIISILLLHAITSKQPYLFPLDHPIVLIRQLYGTSELFS